MLKLIKDKVLVLGSGFLGKAFKENGFAVVGRSDFEFDPDDEYAFEKFSEKYLADDTYDTVINCIGISDTRYCEDLSNWEAVRFGNSTLPEYLSSCCEHFDKKFVHISTGCLYDQNSRPNREDDHLSTHCHYTVSKIFGENGCNHNRDLIVRPRLFFGGFIDPKNLLCKIPEFEKHLNEINSYSSVDTVVESVVALLEYEQIGIFNVAQEGYATIGEIAGALSCPPKPPITGTELQTDQRLCLVNNILDISKLKQFYRPREIFEELVRCNDLMNSKFSK